jgi:hypothetical protein
MQQFHGAAMTDIILRGPVQREDCSLSSVHDVWLWCPKVVVACWAHYPGCSFLVQLMVMNHVYDHLKSYQMQ